ncbi:MAG TPA: ABC transporter permease [Stellaceae bacterium]|nr:ABC transporter permease [Stellaceae bacterium]
MLLALIVRRILYALPIAIGVTVVCFSLVHLAPGDPLNAVVGPDAPADVVASLKRAYGFDKPLPIQYAKWLLRAASGDLGRSVATGRPVTEEMRHSIGNSVALALVGAVIGFTFGCLFGGIAGYAQGGVVDRVASFFALLGVSVPHYWLGMVMVILFSVEFGALPAIGIGPHGAAIWAWTGADWAHAILPAITLAVIPLGIVTRTVRAAVAEALNQEFVQALRAKGLRPGAVLRHVMKNVAPVCLAVMGIQFGYMLGGSILVETVFAWPGTGFLMNDAIFRRDIPVLQGVILVLAMFFVALNLIVDIAQTLIDPRMRRGTTR